MTYFHTQKLLHVQRDCRTGMEEVNAFRKFRVLVCCAAVKYGTVSVQPVLSLLLLLLLLLLLDVAEC